MDQKIPIFAQDSFMTNFTKTEDILNDMRGIIDSAFLPIRR